MSQDIHHPSAGTGPPPAARHRPAAEVAEDEAAEVGRTAEHAGEHVAHRVGEQAREIKAEAERQVQGLLDQGLEQIRGQARDGQRKAATGLHTVADQLAEMSRSSRRDAVTGDIAQELSQRAHLVARWLEQREPVDLVEEVRGFARRRPGAFLLGAAVAGVLAGRLTRGAAGPRRDPAPRSAPSAPGAPIAPGAPPPVHPAPPAYEAPAPPPPVAPPPAAVPDGHGYGQRPEAVWDAGPDPESAHGEPPPATWDPMVDPPLAEDPLDAVPLYDDRGADR